MDELSLQRGLRDRPPADPHYRPRLTAEPGVVAAATTAASSSKARTRPMLSAARLTVAAAIVALFGGLLLAGVLTTPSDDALPAASATATPEATTSLPIQLPKDIPADVRSGVLETPFGPARWVHLTGDDSSLPSELFEVLGTENGYIVADWDGQTGVRSVFQWASTFLPMRPRPR